jgi:hypothetical protein
MEKLVKLNNFISFFCGAGRAMNMVASNLNCHYSQFLKIVSLIKRFILKVFLSLPWFYLYSTSCVNHLSYYPKLLTVYLVFNASMNCKPIKELQKSAIILQEFQSRKTNTQYIKFD